MMKNLIDTWRAGQLIVLSGSSSSKQLGSSQLIVDSFVGLFSHTAPCLWRARACRLERRGRHNRRFLPIRSRQPRRRAVLARFVPVEACLGKSSGWLPQSHDRYHAKSSQKTGASCRVVSCRVVSCRVVPCRVVWTVFSLAAQGTSEGSPFNMGAFRYAQVCEKTAARKTAARFSSRCFMENDACVYQDRLWIMKMRRGSY
eukprot:COSAG06_NODE_4289_length_4396_cov_2.229230_2_plen_201_part_00